MDAVKELSSEFAAAVLNRVETNEKIDRAAALALIRHFHNTLRPLMIENRRRAVHPTHSSPALKSEGRGAGS